MRNSTSLNPARRFRGLSLPEVMISLTITATVLVAVAAAFSASASVIQKNDSFFRCTQAGRVTLNQVLAEIRNCDSMDMSVPNTIKIIRPAKNVTNQQYALTTNELSRSFVYDAANNRITLQISYVSGPPSPVYELANNIVGCSLGPAEMGLDYNNAEIPVRVPILLTISAGGNTIVLDGSAAPRRAMKY